MFETTTSLEKCYHAHVISPSSGPRLTPTLSVKSNLMT